MWIVLAFALFFSVTFPFLLEDSTLRIEFAAEIVKWLHIYAALIISVIISIIVGAIIQWRFVAKKRELTVMQKVIKNICVQMAMAVSFIALAHFWAVRPVSYFCLVLVIMIATLLGVMWERFNAKRQFQLGMSYLYLSGTVGSPENTKEALRLFHQSAKQGYAEAQFFLGMCYANGSGVPQNKKKALKWYRKAAEQGHERAKEFLDQLKK